MYYSPNKTILNPKCEDVYQEIEVFQVLDNYIFGHVCREKYEYSGNCSDSIVVYMKKDKDTVYYDDQKIQVPNGKCITYSKSYTYETKSKDTKTVPVVKFVDKEISNPEYEKWEKEQKKSEK